MKEEECFMRRTAGYNLYGSRSSNKIVTELQIPQELTDEYRRN
jgi:hypothetical protein